VITPETERTRAEHGWCLQLKSSQAFAYYTSLLEKRYTIAMRDVVAVNPPASREYHAGYAAGLTEALTILEKRYKELAGEVERIES
jgi:hypothetical protein